MAVSASTQNYGLIAELSQTFQLSVKQIGELLDIHPRTLQRRQESGRLEEAELLKAQMLDETFNVALTVFGDTERARAWLFSPLPALEFKRPVDLLGTIRGYERVKTLLGQIAFGTY